MKRAFFLSSAGLCLALACFAGPDTGFAPYDSGPVAGDGPAKKISINVTGVKTLRLLAAVENGHANCNIWAEPKLIAKDGTVTPLTSLKPNAVAVGWGQLLVNTNWQGHPLRIGSQTFTNGLRHSSARTKTGPTAVSASKSVAMYRPRLRTWR